MAAPAWGSWRAPSTRSVVCVGLCMQNCVGMLVLSYSRLRDAPMYLSGVLVLCCELLKLVFNLIGLLTQSEESASIVAQLHTLLVRDARHLWRYAVPALLYTLQNNIVFVGVSNLSAATFQVTNQLRIPITALCMRFILNQRLTRRQYLAIAVLVAGVILVQANPEKLNDRGGRYRFNSHPRRPLLGLMAVLVQCTCSAFAGVWFEKILKKPPYPGATLPSIWISNIILGICSLPLSLMVVFGAERRWGPPPSCSSSPLPQILLPTLTPSHSPLHTHPPLNPHSPPTQPPLNPHPTPTQPPLKPHSTPTHPPHTHCPLPQAAGEGWAVAGLGHGDGFGALQPSHRRHHRRAHIQIRG